MREEAGMPVPWHVRLIAYLAFLAAKIFPLTETVPPGHTIGQLAASASWTLPSHPVLGTGHTDPLHLFTLRVSKRKVVLALWGSQASGEHL